MTRSATKLGWLDTCPVSGTGSPPRPVVAAFGARGNPRPLGTGRVRSWRVDGIVLKHDADHALQEWLGTTLIDIPRDGFRLADPVPTADGQWVHDGWSATRWVTGTGAEQQSAPRRP